MTQDFYTRRRQFRLYCSQPLRWRKSMRELREALEALLDISPFAKNKLEGEIHLQATRAIRDSRKVAGD